MVAPHAIEHEAPLAAHAERARRHGRGHVAAGRARRPAHFVARARERAEDLHRGRGHRSAQAQGGRADRPAAWPYAIQFARIRRRPDGCGLPGDRVGNEAGRLRDVRYLGSRASAFHFDVRRLGAELARLPPALVRRRQTGAHGVQRREIEAATPEGRPGLALGRCEYPRQADRHRSLALARHHGRRRCAAAAAPAGEVRRRVPRAQHQRVPGASRPLLPGLPGRRHDGARHLRQKPAEDALALVELATLQRLHPHGAAALQPRSARGDRRVHPGRRQGLAQAGLAGGREGRDEPREHQHAARDRRDASPAQGRALWRAQRARESTSQRRLALGRLRARHFLQRRGSRLRRARSLPAARDRALHPAGARWRAGRHVADQRCLRRRSRHRLRGRSPRGRALRAGDESLAMEKRALLPQHSRYDYVPLPERRDYSWPGGKRLAFVITSNVEWFAFGAGLGHDPAKTGEPQTHRNYAWRDYGNRIGIWRLLDLFDELKLPAAHNTNTLVYDYAPQVMAAIRKRGDEVVAHGRTNSENLRGLSQPDEERILREATETITRREGKAPKGWIGSGANHTANTPDLLTGLGYKYLMDRPMDDKPVWMRTRSGPILSVPYPIELNDSQVVIHRKQDASDFCEMI